MAEHFIVIVLTKLYQVVVSDVVVVDNDNDILPVAVVAIIVIVIIIIFINCANMNFVKTSVITMFVLLSC